MTALFPHQAKAVNRIVERKPIYLGFDMGLGKTRTVIEAAKAACANTILVLCPASAVLVWKREIQKWLPKAGFVVVKKREDLSQLVARPGFYIVSHGLLSQKAGPVAAAIASKCKFDMTVIDEAHAFNAADSLRVKVLRQAAGQNRLGQIIPLSGTPMRNHAGDLYTLMQICYPQGLGTMTRYQYEDIFCRVRTISVQTRYGLKNVRTIEGSKNIPQLREIMKPFMLRVRKEDVLADLPPINWDTVPIELDRGLISSDDLEALGEALHDAFQGVDPNNTDATARALSIIGGVHLMRLRRILGIAKLRGACEYIVDMLDNLPADRKVLVFAVHTDVISSLKHHLDEYDPALVTGQTSPREREAAVDKFLMKPQCRVFIGNIQAAGTALTLVGPTCRCADVVFVESSWTAADNAQAACRVHRIGQRDGVNARMLFADGTVDDLVSSTLARKASEFTALFDKPTP